MPPIRDMEIGIISGVIILKVIDQNYQEINGISLSIEIHNLLVQNKNGEINCDFKYMSQYLWTYTFFKRLGPCEISIVGEKVQLSYGGFAYFRNFTFVKTPQGDYYITFKIKDTNIHSSLYDIVLSSNVAKVKITNRPPKTAKIGITLDPQPEIIAYDKFLLPNPNMYFSAISWPY